MARNDSKSPNIFINRELSWLEFNDRVLQEGRSEALPLAERLKFLSIVSSNLDEFFMVRVAGLKKQKEAGVRKKDVSGLTPTQQLFLISGKVQSMIAQQSSAVADVFEQLGQRGFCLLHRDDWTGKQRSFTSKFFANEMLPVLTPLAVEELDPCPLLPGLQLFAGLLVETGVDGRTAPKLVLVPIPGLFPRFLNLPCEQGGAITPIEEVLLDNAGSLFGGREVRAQAIFRITRDADVMIQEDEAADLLSTVQDAVLERKRRSVVRLEISARPDRRILAWLRDNLELRDEFIYAIGGLLDVRTLMQVANMQPLQSLKAPDWSAQTPRDLIGTEDLWSVLQDRDVLLSHPYERFDPVVQLVSEAAEDPDVLAIKQTLYRTSGDSPIIRALAQAAENGKEVTVLVELKARFDEAKNVNWARHLEDAGCHVVYGIAGYKTHAKALLVIRRETGRIRRYVHLATGNYNDKTAKLYSDLGLMTCDEELASDVAAFFNLLTGLSEAVEWQQLVIAPTDLRQRFLDLIDREIQASTPDRPGLIMAKMNSLEDKGVCRALAEASQAGVKVMLNVRGICCLRPGLKGMTDTVHVRSIIDRFLEHARIYYFSNGGHEEVYLASADWMKRNLDRRLEILFPVRDAMIRRRVIDMLNVYFADNVKAWELLPDGRYKRVKCDGEPVRAQEKFYEDAIAAVRDAEHADHQFRPLTRPK